AVTLTGSLAFPTTDCGSAAPAGQSVVLTNNTNVQHTYTVSASPSTFYTVSDPNAGVIAANGTATITVTPITVVPGPTAQAGSGAYAANLTVAIAGGDTIIRPISWTLNGAVLTATSSTLALSRNNSTLQFTNTGTQTVFVDTSFTSLPLGAVTVGLPAA